MTEVTIREHTRRGKNGKTVQVRSYTRRVGKKGMHSPKRGNPGEEFKAKAEEKVQSAQKLSPEEIKRRMQWEEDFKRFETERNTLGMTREQYSRYLSKKKRPAKESETEKREKSPAGEKRFDNILEKVEDKIAKFVDKYGGGKKYRRQL